MGEKGLNYSFCDREGSVLVFKSIVFHQKGAGVAHGQQVFLCLPLLSDVWELLPSRVSLDGAQSGQQGQSPSKL